MQTIYVEMQVRRKTAPCQIPYETRYNSLRPLFAHLLEMQVGTLKVIDQKFGTDAV